MDDPRILALRGLMRMRLAAGQDAGAAVFAAVRRARLDGIPNDMIHKAVSDLQAEGLLPTPDRSTLDGHTATPPRRTDTTCEGT